MAENESSREPILKLRGVLANDPVDALLAAIALVGVALCNERGENDVYPRLKRVHRLLDNDDSFIHGYPEPGRTLTVEYIVTAPEAPASVQRRAHGTCLTPRASSRLSLLLQETRPHRSRH